MKERIKRRLKTEKKIVGREIRALESVFLETPHNVTAKQISTILMFGSWAVLYAGMAFNVGNEPPMFLEFTVLVWAILARWWGIELVHLSVSDPEYLGKLMNQRPDDAESREKGDWKDEE